jgi:hypothetical protein
LIDARDLARIKTWVEKYPWARDARAQIIKRADAYPARYLQKYNLTASDLPPTGGQWSLWYICPDGLRLQYQPAHTPPHFCPSDGRYYASPAFINRPTLYDEVIYQNRHLDLAAYARDLGLAYALTGESKYARDAANILRAYANAYPNYLQHDKDGGKARSGGKATAQTLDEAQWLIDLAWSFDLVNDTLAADDRAKIANQVLRPAVANIQANRAKLSNWQTWHNAAIAIVGFALNDATLVNEAYYDSENGFMTQIENGAAQDGFWWEGSWGYHFFTLEPMLYLAEMGARIGINPYAQTNLHAMLRAPIQMAMPNRALPPFNDDSGTSLAARAWLYEIGYARYRDPILATGLDEVRAWQALLWGAEQLPPANARASMPSLLLPKAGYAILRAGDQIYLAFDFGPHGGGHGHYDKLGYVAFALDTLLAIDPGTRSYAASAHTTWDKATVAHNTVVVDEQNQVEATGRAQQFIGFPAFSVARADAGAANSTRALITRTLALAPEYWIDVTRAASLDRAPHRFDWIYHNAGTLTTPYSLAPYTGLPKKNGYEHLANPRGAITNDPWQATFELSRVGQTYGSLFTNNDAIAATQTITRAGDTFAAQLDYDFGAIADGYVVYLSKPLVDLPRELPTQFDLRVFGDGSNNRLSLRVMDATGEKFVKQVGTINWIGWQTIKVAVDSSWSHSAGNDNGKMDLPVSQVAVQINRVNARAGRILTDDLALTFAGQRVVVQDFETSIVRVAARMLGAPDTTLVTGDGIDARNQPIPFVMARRSATATTFAVIFEPHRTTPRITTFDASGAGIRVGAPGAFTDSILIAPDTRAFDSFTTDAAIAYARRDALNRLQTLVLAQATRFADSGRVILSSTAPITAQIQFAGDQVAITTQDTRVATLRVYTPTIAQVIVNGNAVELKREGEYIVVVVP